MRQNTEIKALALKNQDLQHHLELQDLKIQQQNSKISTLQDQLESINTATQKYLITQE